MNKKDHKYVIYWLLSGCALIFLMVVIGGITRLTHSGLSISNYKLISGAIPPLNQTEWEAAFELYKQYPEYQKLNYHFTLEDFKSIFFWEWLHRLIGRVIGLVFIIPFLYFLIRKQLTKPTLLKSLVLLGMGAFQGFMGWYMVKSGLVDRPDVSHFRLAAHLTTAFITFAYSFWVALDLIFPNRKESTFKGLRNLIGVTLLVLMVQIVWGAFVAGLDAGFIHNFWPTMSEGHWIHETVYTEQEGLWQNFTQGKSGVQFVHRYLAYIVVVLVAMIAYSSRKYDLDRLQKKGVQSALALTGLQFVLGIFTLVFAVPLLLGVAHQIGAFFLLAVLTFSLHRFSK
ncbi:COX15/CtaA family protein [Sediminicola luteus]|uniref:Heme A synthase n=1 Tax=Sediminicola luteus TaxID=319238 RepID=A0A2A4G8G5_9FLAO|nr:COX15/CtaA family protein [Sediminicola luteus]PCE64264.1 heme A synthase [Sediminicola luteus]